MSISSIHFQKILNSISRYYYSLGVKPTEEQVMNDISIYFSRNNISSPLRIKKGVFADDLKSSVNDVNEIISKTIANLDMLYASVDEQIQESMDMTTFMNSKLEKLRLKRKRIENQIDEYLFANSNSDGYFYSFSDTFPNLNFVDLNLTSAFVDVINGSVSLPILTDATEVLQGSVVRNVSKKFTLNNSEVSYGVERSPFAGCLDGLSNTYWSVEIASDSPSDAICVLELAIPSPALSTIEYEPYGTTPCQVLVETAQSDRNFVVFGNGIKEGTSKMVYSSNLRYVEYIRFTIRKLKYDYIMQSDSGTKYIYIFGAKDIAMIGKHFVPEATFVSAPISISKDLSEHNVLDSVALKVDEDIPDSTQIKYFVSLDTEMENPSLYDFEWRKISPYKENGDQSGMVIDFSGASSLSKFIRNEPESTELQLIPEDKNNPDSRLRNPFEKDGISLWRICNFDSVSPIPQSLRLQEGYNSLRVYYVGYNVDALNLNFWAGYKNGSLSANSVFTRIDSGNGFFWGGDIGENYKSVYMETYIDCETTTNAGIQTFVKTDYNSQLWDVKVFLNGAEIGSLPVGVNSLKIPWTFNAGINHIAVTALIPKAQSTAYPNEGSINLMENKMLYDFGTVRLDNWSYVDLFQLLNNSNDSSNLYSLYSDADKVQLVSRKKPSNNLKVDYSIVSNTKNQKVRIRADFNRSTNDTSVSPVLNSYRLRFRYS